MEKNYSVKRLMEYYQQIRRTKKLNPTDIERETGVARQTIYKYEKGQSIPSIAAMNKLLKPLGYQLGFVPLEKEDDDSEEESN